MKIFFNSEEEKQDFIVRLCPGDVLKNVDSRTKCFGLYFAGREVEECAACWANCGVEMEVYDH